MTSRETFKCTDHAEKQRLYCLECEKLICPLCHSVGSHKSHSVLFVNSEIGEKNKSTLKSCIASAESNIYKVTRALAQVEGSTDTLQQQSQNTKAKISEVVEDLIAALRARQASLVGVVEQLEGKAGKELRRREEKLNQQLTELKHFKLLTEDLLEHGIPEEQICMKKSVVQRIAAITAAPFPASGPPCNIHFDSSAINTSLKEELSQVGALMGGVSPQNCTMENLPAPVDDGVLRVQNMPFTFEVITRDEDSKPCQEEDSVVATLSPSTCGVHVLGRVEKREGDRYQVQFDTLPAAQCQLCVVVNGGHTRGSPLIVRVHMVQDIGTDVRIFRDPGLQRHFRSLTVGKDGCVIAADTCNKEVCIFDRSGCIVKHFQVKQASSGCIDGIAEVQEKNVAVGDYSKNCITVYTPNGQFVREFNVSGGPSGLAVSARGQLFVAEYLSHRVSVFNQSGRYQYSFGSKGGGPGQFQKPEQICITSDGLVCVTDGGNNRVQVFEQGGEFVRQFGKDVLKSPSGVAMTKDGHVVVASREPSKLSFFTMKGQCVHEVTDIGLNCPYSVAADARGWLYVADCDNHRILKL